MIKAGNSVKFFTIFYEVLPDSKIRNQNFGGFCANRSQGSIWADRPIFP